VATQQGFGSPAATDRTSVINTDAKPDALSVRKPFDVEPSRVFGGIQNSRRVSDPNAPAV
jgi:hypothetical protein